MASKQCCYIGRGQVYLQKHEDSCPTEAAPWDTALLPIGNSSSLELTINENIIEQKSYTSVVGGTECSFSEIESIDLNVTNSCFKIRNLVLALFGNSQDVVSAAVTEEVHRVNAECELIPFKNQYDKTVAPVITDGGMTTYVAGVDYILKNNGIEILEGTTMTLGEDIEVNYTIAAHSQIEIATIGQDFYRLVFDGVNAADNKPMYFELYKLKFNPVTGLTLISDEFADLPLSAKVLKWPCVAETNSTSQYGIFRLPS